MRSEVDLNMNAKMSKLEVYAGLTRLVKKIHWYDSLADLVWGSDLS